MSDKPIENLAVGWLPGVNVPAHPPDAVSGATTPAQQSGRIVSVSDHVTLRPIPGTNGDGWTSDPLPASTPEAQIPECVHAPEEIAKPKAYTYPCHGSGFFGYYDVGEMDAYCASLESQLAALRVERDQALERERISDEQVLNYKAWAQDAEKERDEAGVERDQAWNEAIEAAAQLVSRIYPNATKYDIERLARPIPAEPKCEEK